MSKPHVHAINSAKQYGGKPEDYLDIHQLMDSSKEAFSDVRHRAATHTGFFITKILPLIFGETRKNSDNVEYSVRDIGEQHALEDFGGLFIPSVQDFFSEMKLTQWMDNAREGAVPPGRNKSGSTTKETLKQNQKSEQRRKREPKSLSRFEPRFGPRGLVD